MVAATPPTPVLQVLGRATDPHAYRIRDFLTRSAVGYDWVELRTDEECRAAVGADLGAARLPVVRFEDGAELVEPSLREIAGRLGWLAEPRRTDYDLAIFGAGPAGLSAAVYAASEGLSTVVIERGAVGGQAGSSSLIENYLGFPHGIAGDDLAGRAREQADRFGAEILLLQEGVTGAFHDGVHLATLADGRRIRSRASVCATGVEWRRLGLPDEDRLLGAGLYYGAGTSEAALCRGRHVFVVGGANSAGQAAMNLANHGATVTMLVRAADLSNEMSDYLRTRVEASDAIRVRTHTRVASLEGEHRLEAVVLEDTETGARSTEPASEVFVCIGGDPCTRWADHTSVVRDRKGFLVTGLDLTADQLAASGWPLDRAPFHLETSVPGCFAGGDVRYDSVKRVASAVGDGAGLIPFVHRFLHDMA